VPDSRPVPRRSRGPRMRNLLAVAMAEAGAGRATISWKGFAAGFGDGREYLFSRL